MIKPKNTYKERTIIWSVLQGSLDRWPDGGWCDLTVRQIAEVLCTSEASVYGALRRIKREKGYSVPHVFLGKGDIK